MSKRNFLFFLRHFSVAALYAVLAMLALTYFSPDGVIGVLWPPSGLALAVLILGGRRYAWAVLAGSLTFELWSGLPAIAALVTALGATAAALLSHTLLARDARFDNHLTKLGDYARLLWKGVLPASAFSALVGVSCLTAVGFLPVDNMGVNCLYWAMGDGLGIMLVTPLLLICRTAPRHLVHSASWPEALLIGGLTLLAGQVIFLGWFPDAFPAFPRKGYWMFPLFGWAAARIGRHGVIALLCLISMQVMRGIHANVAFFSNAGVEVRLLDGWFFLTVLSGWGLSLAVYFRERMQSEMDLRIAATAFECQEGMIVTDPEGRILRTNQSFTRITGYAPEEVVGKTTEFMRSDRHPTAFYENAWAEGLREGSWSSELWSRRKNGEVFPQWVTGAAVKNAQGGITHAVITHTDISHRQIQEEQRAAEEIAHRDALVREVHHRIKNSLQGISGMLQQFAIEHPELAGITNQVVTQVRSIASLHGLQGRTSVDTVRLCELTSAIARDIQTVWQTSIRVDIPSDWLPRIIAEKEAVPIALVLNELIVNAVKHGGKAHGNVFVTLRQGAHPEAIQLSIYNLGTLKAHHMNSIGHHAGLQLVESLMPRDGAQLNWEQEESTVVTRLELASPVIKLETGNPHEPT